MSTPTCHLKILIAAPLYPPDPGGPALHAACYVARFSQKGIATQVAVFSRLLWLPFGVRHAVFLAQLLWKARGVSVIYALDTNSVGWAAFMVAFLLRKKLLLRIGGDLLWERLAEFGKVAHPMSTFYASGAHQSFFLYYTVRFSLHRADRIIVPTALLKDVYVQWYGIAAERLTVIPNPVPERVDIGYVKEQRTIVYASRMVRYKNLDCVLDAIAEMRHTLGPPRFVLMGDGPELPRLRDRVAQEGLQSWVTLPGRVTEERVLQETQGALLTLGPASTEFSPNAVLRGLAYGKPFLISREHGLPFTVPEMLLFDPASKEEFIRKLTYLLTPDGYLAAKSWLATLDYHQSWEDAIKKNLEIIRGICSR